jgi:sugar phosphate isomerase/epimerase
LSNFNGQEHRRPEDGHLSLDHLLAALVKDDYQGAISLELTPAALNAGCSDQEMVATLATSLDYCRGWATH